MSGPDGVSVPPSDQDLGLGKKTTRDLADNLKVTVDGKNVKFTGNLNNITTPWKEFDASGNNTGHFVPIQLPDVCADKDVIFKGKAADATIHIDEDRLLIIRLENLTGLTATIELEDETLMVLDFTALVPVGEAAYDAAKSDFGGYGLKDQYVQDLSIAWNGVRGTVKGILKHHDVIGSKNVSAGNHFPLSMSAWYDGVPKIVGAKNPRTIPEKDIIISIVDKTVLITAKYNGKTVLELDLSGMKVEPFVGADAISIADQSEDMDAVRPASLLIADDVKIAWSGIRGTVTGTVHEYQMTDNHFDNAKGHFLPICTGQAFL